MLNQDLLRHDMFDVSCFKIMKYNMSGLLHTKKQTEQKKEE